MTPYYCPTIPKAIKFRLLVNKRTRRWWQVWKRTPRNYFEVDEPFPVVVFEGDIFYVPAGFKTDLASIPKALRSVISVVDNHMAAAVVHDYLYRSKEGKKRGRKFSDNLFLRIMEEMGVNKVKRTAMHWGVRAGGGRSFGGKK
jgi:hypothetical protein